MVNECEIVQGLILLVNDGVASKASCQYVYQHCRHCQEYHALLQEPPIYDEQQLMNKFQRKIHYTFILTIIFLSLFACGFSATRYQFNNFFLMHIIGAIGLLLM